MKHSISNEPSVICSSNRFAIACAVLVCSLMLVVSDSANPWAIYGSYIDRVVIQCVNELIPKWSARLAGYDVYIWDQCYAMEQSLRIDEP